MLLETYRQTLVESVLTLLWRQWSLLGVPGHEGRGSDSQSPAIGCIIDPEALLLATSEIGRFDARLFDEALHWLQEYGRLINIQRLKTLSQTSYLGNPNVLAAIAAIVSQNSRLTKWKALQIPAAATASGNDPQTLFKSATGHRSSIDPTSKLHGNADPHFLSYGFIRGPYILRRDATAPQVARNPELLLIKLRALIGVNARAEIIAALLSSPNCTAHPSGLAAQTGYLARSLQDILNEMAISGHVFITRSKRAREKYFILRQEDWNFLITWGSPQQFPVWINWSTIFSLLQDTITTLYSSPFEKASPLMAALQCRKIYERHLPALTDIGLARHFTATSVASGADFPSAFLGEIIALTAK